MATEHFCLRWNNHQSTLISVFDNLLERETLVDCTLAADGRYLKAHKVVLSACSPFLGMLLTQHYDKHPIIILKDVKFDELKAMLDYMYRGEVNISQEQLSAFLKAAESLQIKGLSDSGAEELNSLHSNRPPSSNSTTSATNEDPQSPVAVVESGSPSSRNKRKIDKDDLLDGEISSKHSASDSSVLDGRSVPCVSDSPSTAKNLNLLRIKSEPIVEVSEQMSTTSSVDESSESAMFSRPGPSNESGPSNKGSSWGPSMDNSWDGVQVTPGQGITPNSQESENAAHWFVPLIHLASPTTPTDKNLDKKHSCLTCGKSYQLASSLYTHEKYQCNKEPQFSCPYCPHKTKLKGNLKAHIGFKHANLPRPF